MKQLGALKSFDGRPAPSKHAGTRDPRPNLPAGLRINSWPQAAGISGSRYVQLEGAHGVIIQRSTEVNQLLREHFAAAASFAETD